MGWRRTACRPVRTAWAELPGETRDLLKTPLHLHLFMDAFDGVPAGAVRVAPELFRRHIDHALRGDPDWERALDPPSWRISWPTPGGRTRN